MQKQFFLPHHTVLGIIPAKAHLFDASLTPQQIGLILNDNLKFGPQIQDLSAIMIDFRSFLYVLNGGLAKMNGMIRVHPGDQNKQLNNLLVR